MGFGEISTSSSLVTAVDLCKPQLHHFLPSCVLTWAGGLKSGNSNLLKSLHDSIHVVSITATPSLLNKAKHRRSCQVGKRRISLWTGCHGPTTGTMSFFEHSIRPIATAQSQEDGAKNGGRNLRRKGDGREGAGPLTGRCRGPTSSRLGNKKNCVMAQADVDMTSRSAHAAQANEVPPARGPLSMPVPIPPN